MIDDIINRLWRWYCEQQAKRISREVEALRRRVDSLGRRL